MNLKIWSNKKGGQRSKWSHRSIEPPSWKTPLHSFSVGGCGCDTAPGRRAQPACFCLFGIALVISCWGAFVDGLHYRENLHPSQLSQTHPEKETRQVTQEVVLGPVSTPRSSFSLFDLIFINNCGQVVKLCTERIMHMCAFLPWNEFRSTPYLLFSKYVSLSKCHHAKETTWFYAEEVHLDKEHQSVLQKQGKCLLMKSSGYV